MEFEVVGLELELVDEIFLILEEEAVSGWAERYVCSRMLSGGTEKDEGVRFWLISRNYFHLRLRGGLPEGWHQIVEALFADLNAS